MTGSAVTTSVATTWSGVFDASTRSTSNRLRFDATSSIRKSRLTMGRRRSGRRKVDERAVVDVFGVDRGAEFGLPGEKVRAVQRAGRGSEDAVERVYEAEALEAADHPGRNDAAHPAAFNRERDPRVVVMGRRAAAGCSRAQERGDATCHS